MPNLNDHVENTNKMNQNKGFSDSSKNKKQVHAYSLIQNTNEYLNNDLTKFWVKYFEKNKYAIGITLSLILAYLLLGKIMGYIHSITELIVFSILPLKIILHVMCNQNEPPKYNNYSSVLLKQMFLVVLTKTLISFVPFLDLIPIVRIISYPIYLILISFAIIIQVPVTMLNKIINIIMDKTKLGKNSFIRAYLHINPVYDRIINKITNIIDITKITYMRTIRNILLKYESDISWNPKDMNKVSSALGELGINQIVDNIDIKSSLNGIIKQIN